MQRSFGHSLELTLTPTRPWFSLGPGWAALAGALSTGLVAWEWADALKLISLWLLVDPLLGTLWELAAPQGLWRKIGLASLPPAPVKGFNLPYAQPEAPAGRLVLRWRRFGLWWRKSYWPEAGDRIIAFGLGAGLVILIGLALDPLLFWLVLLALFLTLLAGQLSPDLTTPEGGRLQSIVQLLLPWAMGMLLWSADLAHFGLVLGICYWVVYLGGLRLLGGHRRAEILFFLGQLAAILLLLALHLLPGAAVLTVLIIAQYLLRTGFSRAADFLPKVQVHLVFGLIIAALSLGQLSG